MSVKSMKDKLKDILKKLNSGEDPQEVKKEARELLKNIETRELSETEQELVKEGLPENELRHLCKTHIDVMNEELENLKMNLPVKHPLNTLIKEHDEILNILNRLEKVNSTIQEMDEYIPENYVFEELKELAHHLIETEKHHTREEESLFPRLEEKEITGPPNIMRMEHDDLWPGKERIDYLIENVERLDFDEFKKKLNKTVKSLVSTLRDHIFKENNILYPTAYDMLDENLWEKIKEECDRIGYCCFVLDND